MWDKFYNSVEGKPSDYGLSLGKKNYIAIIDTPFDLYLTSFHDFGSAYLKCLTPETAELSIYEKGNTLGISQIIAFLDVCTLPTEDELEPTIISQFIVGNQMFTTLTKEAIYLIKINPKVIISLNLKNWGSDALCGFHFLFIEDSTKVKLSEEYLERAMNARIKYNL